MCGYSEIQVNKKITNEMFTYVDPTTGKVDGIYNETADFINIQPKGSKTQIKLQRQDKYEESKKVVLDETPPKQTTPVSDSKPVEVTTKKV